MYSYDRRVATYLDERPGRTTFLGTVYVWISNYETRDRIDAPILKDFPEANKLVRTHDFGKAREVPGGWAVPWTAQGRFKQGRKSVWRDVTDGVDTVTLEPFPGGLRAHLHSKSPVLDTSFMYRDVDYSGQFDEAVRSLTDWKAPVPKVKADHGRRTPGGWDVPVEFEGRHEVLRIETKPQAAKTGQNSVFLANSAEFK